MKVLFYCQHVLGIGHLFRTLAICKGLYPHPVTLVTGGEPVAVPMPGHVREVRLPGLMMDAEFTGLFNTGDGRAVERVRRERRRRLWDLFRETGPDLFLIELFPFGRKAFGFELDPLLEGIRTRSLPSARVVCSLRDILVEKKDQRRFEKRVLASINRHFDALLVHSDPGVIRLDETFTRVGEIRIPVVYTGFVTDRPAPDARRRLRAQLQIRRRGAAGGGQRRGRQGGGTAPGGDGEGLCAGGKRAPGAAGRVHGPLPGRKPLLGLYSGSPAAMYRFPALPGSFRPILPRRICRSAWPVTIPA